VRAASNTSSNTRCERTTTGLHVNAERLGVVAGLVEQVVCRLVGAAVAAASSEVVGHVRDVDRDDRPVPLLGDGRRQRDQVLFGRGVR